LSRAGLCCHGRLPRRGALLHLSAAVGRKEPGA